LVPMKFLDAFKHRSTDTILGILTIVLVAFFTLNEWASDDVQKTARLALTPGLFVFVITTICLFVFGLVLSNLNKKVGIVLMAVGLIPLTILFINGFILILAIIFVAELAVLVSLPLAVVIGVILPFTYFPLAITEQVWTNSALFVAFNMFAVFISYRLKKEREARLHVSHLLRELSATQELLSTTSKRDERLRIARDIHDVLGHHLTALSLQLEIAEQLSTDSSKGHISRAKSISKMLLSDIRETVSDLRSQAPLNIHSALHVLTQNQDALDVQLYIGEHLIVHDARVAEALFRAVQEAMTNILKHTAATQCTVEIERINDIVELRVFDNGGISGPIKMGHGLKGMKERVEALDGQMRVQETTKGLEIAIKVPDPQDYI